MKKKSLPTKKVLRTALLVLLLGVAGMTRLYAYDFSAVCETGQRLYYSITDATNHYVCLTCPGSSSYNAWSGFTKPTGDIMLPSTVDHDEITYTVTSISDYAFASCNHLTGNLIIPDAVTSIGRSAFNDCYDLTSLEIPHSVTSIGNSAFSYCESLNSVMILADNPPILEGVYYVFSNVNKTIPVYVPCGFEEAYASANWGGFSNYVGLCAGEITVTANPAEGGTVSGGGYYEGSTTCTLSATANTGYTFVNWTENGLHVSSHSDYSFKVSGSRALEANFSNSGNCPIIANDDTWSLACFYWPVTINVLDNDFIPQGTSPVVSIVALPSHGELVILNDNAIEYTCNHAGYSGMDQFRYRVSSSQGYDEATVYVTVGHEPYVSNISAPDPICAGGALGIPVPSVNPTFPGVWQKSQTNTGTDWSDFDPNSIPLSMDGWYVRYAAANYCGERRSNAVQIAVFDCTTANYWTPVDPGLYPNSTIIQGVIQINGVEQFTDHLELGAFCGEECRGSQHASYFPPTGRYIIQLMVFGENNDVISFRLYDHQQQQELPLTPPMDVAINVNGYGSLFAPYVLNFTSSSVIQTRTLTKGWNWYSTYIEQEGVDGLEQLENSIGIPKAVIRSKNDGYVKSVRQNGQVIWQGTLSSINNEKMYKIGTKVACTATVEGEAADPASHPITINKGWNWIGFPCNYSVDVSEALSDFTPKNGDVIKSINSYTAYYSDGTYSLWYGTLNTLEPGQGYMYGSRSNATKTLVFQTGNRGKATLANITPENNYYQPVDDYADNMTVIAVVELDGKELQSEAYELAAFAGNECRGSVKLMYVEPVNRYVAFLTVFGNEAEDLHFVLTDGADMSQSYDLIRYKTEGIEGSLDEPVVLRFGTTEANDLLTVNDILPTIVTSLVNTSACEDVEFDADIAVTDFTNVGSVSLALNYDTTKLTFLGYENLNSALEDGMLFVNAKDGVVYVSWMSVNGATIDSGTLMSLKFSGIAGSSSLTWYTLLCEYANIQGMVFPNSYQNGTVTIYAAPYITSQPSNKTIYEGSNISFSISAGGGVLSYQWQSRPDEESLWTNLANGGYYENVTDSTLNIYNATPEINGRQYRCEVNGLCGLEYSNSALLTVESEITQTTTLSRGWNWYSTYIEQEGIDGLGQLENSIDVPKAIIQSQNNGYVKSILRNGSVLWRGALSSINNEEMYKIGTKYICAATMEGQVADPSSHPITINKGWNWIGFPCSHSVSVSDALSGFTPRNGDVIKGIHSYATFRNGTWSGTLNTLEPGQGYMYGSRSNTSKTLVFQTGNRDEAVLANITPENNYYQPAEDYADNMTLIAVVELDGEELRSDNYELAAFAGNECRGSVKLMYIEHVNRYVAFLTVFGNETEDLHFVLTDGATSDLSTNHLTYAVDSIEGSLDEPVVLRFGATDVSENASVNVRVYPNPSDGIFNIEGQNIKKVEVFNALGQPVYSMETENGSLKLDLTSRAAGIYLVRIFTNNGICNNPIMKK